MNLILLLLISLTSLWALLILYRNNKLLHPLFIANVLFLVSSVVGYYKYTQFSKNQSLEINDSDVSRYLFFYLLCLLLTIIGWLLGKKSKIQNPKKRFMGSRFLSYWSIILIVISIYSHHLLVSSAGGYISFYSVSHMSALGSQLSGTPVIYMFGLSLGILAILFSVLSFFIEKKKKKKGGRLVLSIFISIVYLIPQILGGDRGEMIKIALIWMLSFNIYRGWKPPKRKFILIGAFSLIFFMGAGAWRENFTINSQSSDFNFEEIFDAAIGSSGPYNGDIFFLSSYLMKISNDNQVFGFGLGYYNYLLYTMVPKVILPSKDDLFLYDARKELINKINYNIGATFDGVSDSYVQFYIFGPFVWFFYFYLLSRIYRKITKDKSDVYSIILYILGFISIVWMFSHGTIGAIGNFIFLILIIKSINNLNFFKL
jgi:oligosaccharide repeat unit polymerase